MKGISDMMQRNMGQRKENKLQAVAKNKEVLN